MRESKTLDLAQRVAIGRGDAVLRDDVIVTAIRRGDRWLVDQLERLVYEELYRQDLAWRAQYGAVSW